MNIPSEQEIKNNWKDKSLNNPLLSVTIITYNHEKFISHAINSVLIQRTDFPFEVIIHDDASSDRTQEIIKEYSDKYPNIIIPILQKENQWLGKGINPTISIVWPSAKGKYIAWIEGDDYWTDKNKLQKQVDFLEANSDFSACFHLTKVCYENSQQEGGFYGVNSPNILTTKDIFVPYAPFHTSSLVFRSAALPTVFPYWYSKIVSNDIALFSILSKWGNLGKINEVMSVYRKHEGGITNTPQIIHTFHQKRIELAQYLNEYHAYRFQDKAEEVIAFHKASMQSSLSIQDFSRKTRAKIQISSKLKKLLSYIFNAFSR